MTNVIVQKNAFAFCRYSLALLVWAALIFRSVWPLVAVFVILVLSAALTVRHSPLLWLYTQTLGKLVPSADTVLDVRGMRMSHTLGAVLAAICIALVWHDRPSAWYAVAAFGVLKTISAAWACPAYRLYGCVRSGGGCCGLAGKR